MNRHPLPSPALQLITGAWRDPADLEARVTAALRGGIRWIQLRAKERSASEVFAAARRLVPLVGEAGGLLVVNDRVDVAIACGAGGVHLPENGMSVRDVRALLGSDAGTTKWIARSVHSVEAVRAAAGDPQGQQDSQARQDSMGRVDALQFGPVFETASKREFGPPQGLAKLSLAAAAARESGIALIAVGGITAAHIEACRREGADGVSVIGAIWDAADVESAAREALRSVARA